MRTTSRRILVIEVIAFAIAVLGVGSASAHSPDSYYKYKWKRDLYQGFRFVSGYPTTTSHRSRILDGLHAWNALNQSLKFAPFGEADFSSFDPYNPCAQPYGRNGIHWKSNSSPGQTWPCVYSTGEMKNSQMVIDSTPPVAWWTGAGLPPSNRLDLWSVATHEWGHMFSRMTGGPDGKGHWGETSSLCPTDYGDAVYDRHTMCPGISAGSWNMSYLHDHDIHTFKSAY